jgi:hypothetical protein
MRTVLVVTLALLWTASCFGETRIIGVEVQKGTDAKTHVTISSDVKEENKANLTTEQAQAILKKAQGWGSTVYVGVQAHGVSARDYLPLLQTIAENPWLELVFVEGRNPDFITDNIKRRIEQAGGGERQSPPPKPLPEVKEFTWGSGRISLGMTKAEVLDQIKRTWDTPAQDAFGARGMVVRGVTVPSEEIQKSDRWELAYGQGSGAAPGGGGLTFVFESGRLIRIIVGPAFA